jgi:hypothetical protein
MYVLAGHQVKIDQGKYLRQKEAYLSQLSNATVLLCICFKIAEKSIEIYIN